MILYCNEVDAILHKSTVTLAKDGGRMDAEEGKRRKYIGVGGDDVPSLGVLEGDVLRLLWDAGEPQSSVQVYESMQFIRRREKREMQSPSTIAVTLSRMVEKGLLSVERRPGGGKGYYKPTHSRAQVVASVMDDVSKRLTGQPLGYLLTRLAAPADAKYATDGASPEDEGYARLIVELKRHQKTNNKPVPHVPNSY